MTFIIPKADRQTAFWSQRTPNTIGPGSYSESPQLTTRYSSVPFSVGSQRPVSTFVVREQKNGSPGPGTYESQSGDLKAAGTKYGTSAFANRVARPEPMVAGATLSSYPTFYYPSPGPGAYNLPSFQEKRTFRQTHRRQKTALLDVSPGAPSIPHPSASVRKTADGGPGQYDISENLTRAKGKSVDFAASKVKRKLWDLTTGMETPGPGHYDPVAKKKKGRGAMTASSGEKLQKEVKLGPGPGTYEPEIPVSTSFSQISSFGSQAKRAPVWLSKNTAPGVGSYNLQPSPLELSQKHQLSAVLKDHLRPPFLTARKRDCLQTVEEALTPGPGSYDHDSSLRVQNFSALVEAGKVKFMSTEPRFQGLFQPKDGPAPGQYAAAIMKPVTTADTSYDHSPRFQAYARDNLQVSISNLQATPPPVGRYNLTYSLLSDQWKKPTKWRPGQSPSSSFDSSANRFDPKESFPGERVKDIPGPGYYKRTAVFDSPVSAGRKSTVPQSKRFDGYGNYVQTHRDSLGPGRYHKEQTLLRRSFNLSVKPRKAV